MTDWAQYDDHNSGDIEWDRRPIVRGVATMSEVKHPCQDCKPSRAVLLKGAVLCPAIWAQITAERCREVQSLSPQDAVVVLHNTKAAIKAVQDCLGTDI
jgi:quinolinate synthase